MRWTLLDSDDDALAEVGDVVGSSSFFDKDVIGVVSMDQTQPVGMTQDLGGCGGQFGDFIERQIGHPGCCGVNGLGSGLLVGLSEMA